MGMVPFFAYAAHGTLLDCDPPLLVVVFEERGKVTLSGIRVRRAVGERVGEREFPSVMVSSSVQMSFTIESLCHSRTILRNSLASSGASYVLLRYWNAA